MYWLKQIPIRFAANHGDLRDHDLGDFGFILVPTLTVMANVEAAGFVVLWGRWFVGFGVRLVE